MDKIWIYVWKQRKLGEVFEQTTNFVNPDKGEIELWSLTVEDGLTPKSERYNREFLVKKNANFKKVRPGDIVYNPMNMTLGAVGYNGMLKNVAVSGYYITMFVKTGYDSYYINTWLKSPQAISLYKTFATGSLIEKQRVQFSTLSIIPTVFPEYEEQKRIGCYFNNLDSLITFHHRKLNILNKICRYAWEQRKVTELLKNSSSAMKIGPFGSALKKEYFVEEGIKVYAQENAFTGDFSMGDYYITEDKYKELKSCELYPGDLVISMMGTIGACAIFPKNAEKGIMNSHLLRLQFNNEVIPKYIMYLLRDSVLIRKQIDRLSVGSIMSGLSSSVVKKLVFPIPKLAEQKRIVEYLDSIDHLITLHQQKCKQLQIIRKYMLKNMFL